MENHPSASLKTFDFRLSTLDFRLCTFNFRLFYFKLFINPDNIFDISSERPSNSAKRSPVR